MLKYAGLPLVDIQQALGQGEEMSAAQLLDRQRELVLEERRRLDCILEVIDQAQRHCREGLLRYLCDLDGELEMRIKSREQEVRRYLQELIRQGETPEIGTEGHCYCCK